MLSSGYKPPISLAADLVSTLTDQIVFGELSPGRRLTEEAVGQWAGVSRSPIREAFRQLEFDGLVMRAARRGVTVTPISLNNLDEVYQCRIELEALAAELAAKRSSPTGVDRLSSKLRELASAFDNKDARGYFRASVSFSETVHELAGNATLRRLLNGVGKQSLRYRFIAYEHVPTFTAESIAGAARLLDDIRNGDTTAAKSKTRDLIQSAWDQIRQHVEDTQETALDEVA